MRGRALGSLVRCSRGGCVSRGSMWDQWLSLTNSQRAPLISRLRDQNLREREERRKEKEENARETERTLNFTQTRAPLVLRYICRRLVRWHHKVLSTIVYFPSMSTEQVGYNALSYKTRQANLASSAYDAVLGKSAYAPYMNTVVGLTPKQNKIFKRNFSQSSSSLISPSRPKSYTSELSSRHNWNLHVCLSLCAFLKINFTRKPKTYSFWFKLLFKWCTRELFGSGSAWC